MAQLSLIDLPPLANPLITSPWLCKRVTTRDVQLSINRGVMLGVPADPYSRKVAHHASRIAWLVQNGWSDPIQIDVGVPSLGAVPDWLIQDGNHRMYAALFRGDACIDADFSGETDIICKLFPSVAHLFS